MNRLAILEKARRKQMKAAAYRSLAEARNSRAMAPAGKRVREIGEALGYLPYNPVQWVKWHQRGNLCRRLRQHLEASSIAFGGGFDRDWYVQRYPDVAGKADPLMHFVRYGASEGRDAAPSHPTSRHLHSVLKEAAAT
jgi:hypothetical protein